MENRVAGWLHRLHRERDNARARLNNCRAELQRFEGYADPETDHDAVMLSKLQRDSRIRRAGCGLRGAPIRGCVRGRGIKFMTNWKNEVRTCACGGKFSPKRDAQRHCSTKCRDVAKKRLKRSGDKPANATKLSGSGDTPVSDVPGGLADGSTMVWPEDRNSPEHGSNPDGSTPGALQGDDYPLEYDENGYPELPACLDRRPKPAIAEAA